MFICEQIQNKFFLQNGQNEEHDEASPGFQRCVTRCPSTTVHCNIEQAGALQGGPAAAAQLDAV